MARLQALAAAVRIRPQALDKARLKPVEVAILDSGVDADHPALRGRVVASYSVEYARRNVAVRPARRKNNDDFGHGTAVASIIARIAPNARLVDIRVLDENNQGSGEALIEGLRFAVKRRTRLINMSLAATAEFAADLHTLCEKAYYQNQVLVAAKRNMPLADNGFPAEFSSCIGVDNLTFPSPFVFRFLPDQVIEYAAHGTQVAVAARRGGYTTASGTSIATPTITGICARILGAYPEMRPFEVKSLLKLYAR